MAEHADAAGFPWLFAVAPPAMIEALVDDFGSAVTVTTQSPIIVVCPDGSVTDFSKIAASGTIADHISDNC